MYCLDYRIKKRFSGSIRTRYVKLKSRFILYKTKENAEKKMKEIKDFCKNSNGLYILDYTEIKEYKTTLDKEQLGIEFDKIYMEESE